MARCDFEGCDKPTWSGGLCRGHYAQRSRGQELRPLAPYRRGGVNLKVRVEKATADKLRTDPGTAGRVLDKWAKRGR